jgi:hypothetical protein
VFLNRLAVGDRDFPMASPQPGTITVWKSGDMMRMLAEFKSAGDKKAYLRGALRFKERVTAYDDWDLRDPLPFFFWGLNSFGNKLLKRQKDSLPDIWK